MRICLVCSSGGHQIEMNHLKPVFDKYDNFLVTHDYYFMNYKKDSKNSNIFLVKNYLLGKSNKNMFYKAFLYIVYFLVVTIHEIIIFLKMKPDVIISTGSAIAIPIFYIGKIFNKKTIYIESICRVRKLSKAGKLIYPIADVFLVQWEELTRKYSKAKFNGCVLSKIQRSNFDIKDNFIFVTVGTSPFPRLVKKIDEISKKLDKKIIMQIGPTAYTPNNVEYFDFVEDFSKIQELYRKSSIIITHCGAGSLITALEQGGNVVAVPRSSKHGEAYDDHQLELAEALSEKGYIKTADINDIERLLGDVERYDVISKGNLESINLNRYLKELLEVLENEIYSNNTRKK